MTTITDSEAMPSFDCTAVTIRAHRTQGFRFYTRNKVITTRRLPAERVNAEVPLPMGIRASPLSIGDPRIGRGTTVATKPGPT